MTDRLPPNLLALFQPRPAVRYLPPNDRAPEERQTAYIDSVAAFLPALKAKKEAEKDTVYTESKLEKQDRVQREKREKQEWLMNEGFKQQYKPNEDPQIRGDAFKTLFISRLPYDIATDDLNKEFKRFGPIERIRIPVDKNEKSKKYGKPKGYAFVLFEAERDMKAAYKECDPLYIRGRKVCVDVERGRTVSGWRPRRFGGGLGGRHYTKVNTRPVGYGPPSAPGGGFRGGGFRGGFDRGGGFRGGRGGFRGGDRGYGGRGGIGYGGPPDAPSGPRDGGFRGGRGGGGFGSYDDRGRGGNANFEPLPPRGGGGGYRDRDRDRDRDYNSGMKRPYEGGGYDESRQRRRY